jgi:hypothetical protein
MVANTAPIYTKTPDVSSNGTTGVPAAITAAAADFTGISANNVLVHTAGANGSYVRKLRIKALGANVATVLRIYINNGSTNATATNNVLYGEIGLPVTNASATVAQTDYDYSFEIALPAGFRIYVGLGTAVAAGWAVLAVAGQY